MGGEVGGLERGGKCGIAGLLEEWGNFVAFFGEEVLDSEVAGVVGGADGEEVGFFGIGFHEPVGFVDHADVAVVEEGVIAAVLMSGLLTERGWAIDGGNGVFVTKSTGDNNGWKTFEILSGGDGCGDAHDLRMSVVGRGELGERGDPRYRADRYRGFDFGGGCSF